VQRFVDFLNANSLIWFATIKSSTFDVGAVTVLCSGGLRVEIVHAKMSLTIVQWPTANLCFG